MLSGRTGLVPYGTVTDPFIKVGWMVHWYVYTPVAVGIACAKVPVVCVLEAGIEAAAANVTLCRAMPPVHVHVAVTPAVTWISGGVKLKSATVTEVVTTGVVPPPPPPPFVPGSPPLRARETGSSSGPLV